MSLKQWFESYFGIAPAPTGQGTDWRWLIRSPWPESWPQWWLVLVVVGIVTLVVWLYRRDAQSLSRGQRGVLLALRGVVLLLMLALLTELSIEVRRTGLPSLAVMVDTSASMSLIDQPETGTRQSPRVRTLAKELGREPSRWELTQDILLRDDGRWFRDLQESHPLRLYQFDETALPIALTGATDAVTGVSTPVATGQLPAADGAEQYSVAGLKAALEALAPTGSQTRPAVAVKKVLADLRGAPPAGIVLFTDGVASLTDADKLSTVADACRRRGVPLLVVGLGSDEPTRDLQLYDTLVEDVAFINDPLSFTARMKAFGFAGQEVELRLRAVNSEEVLARRKVVAGPDGQSQKVELTWTPDKAGEFDLVLELTPASRETDPENNREIRHVSVREEKIRVLLADSAPRYEFRYMKQLFERDPSVELKTLLLEADVEYAQEDRTAISLFPVKREELFRYDVIVLGDIPPSTLSPGVMEMVREFVRDKGGGLICIAGPSQMPAAFAGTALESLFPFESSAKLPNEPNLVEAFHANLTLEGQKGTGLFRFAPTDAECQRIWQAFPESTWLHPIPVTRPGALVLAEHPTRQGKLAKLPLILLQRVGAGKVLFHANDETWRWRYRVGDLYFGRYWVQAVRLLSRSKMIGKDRTAELSADRLVYQRGEAVSLRVRFLDERFLPKDPDGVAITLENQGGGRQTLTLSRVAQVATLFEAQTTQLPDGSYHAWISRPSFNEAPPSADFRIESPLRELQKRNMDRVDLQAAAKTSGGQFYTVDEVDRLLSELPPGNPVTLNSEAPLPLWNRPELLGLIIAVLTLEWGLRKRWKLV